MSAKATVQALIAGGKTQMKLYWSWFINPQKVRLALNELGLAHEIVALRLLQGEQHRPEFLALNLMGRRRCCRTGT